MMGHQTQIVDEGSLHKYRTEIPNTVVKGLKSRDLSIYAKWLYVYIKSVTGENGGCWQSTETLAKLSGMSQGKVSQAKAELITQKLITVTQGNAGKHESDTLKILDIWEVNMREFSGSLHTPSPHEPVDKGAAQALSTDQLVTGSCGEGAGSCGEPAGSCGESERVHVVNPRRSQDLRRTLLRRKPKISPNGEIPSVSTPKRQWTAEAKIVLAYLNEQAGSRYQNPDMITHRLKDGGTVTECRLVIDWYKAVKCATWDHAYQYFRPQTLFARRNFDSYLGLAIPWQENNRPRGGTAEPPRGPAKFWNDVPGPHYAHFVMKQAQHPFCHDCQTMLTKENEYNAEAFTNL